jgi:hypothetical protein
VTVKVSRKHKHTAFPFGPLHREAPTSAQPLQCSFSFDRAGFLRAVLGRGWGGCPLQRATKPASNFGSADSSPKPKLSHSGLHISTAIRVALTPFQAHYFSGDLVAPGIEPGTSGSVASETGCGSTSHERRTSTSFTLGTQCEVIGDGADGIRAQNQRH